MYGDNWAEIAEHVGTKSQVWVHSWTSVQCRICGQYEGLALCLEGIFMAHSIMHAYASIISVKGSNWKSRESKHNGCVGLCRCSASCTSCRCPLRMSSSRSLYRSSRLVCPWTSAVQLWTHRSSPFPSLTLATPSWRRCVLLVMFMQRMGMPHRLELHDITLVVWAASFWDTFHYQDQWHVH